jgi:PAS domain S-box-containing protein
MSRSRSRHGARSWRPGERARLVEAPERRVHEALRSSEEGFRLLVEGVKEYAIYRIDLDGRVASWNAGAERLKGFHAEEIIGQPYSRFFPSEDARAGKPERLLATAVRDGQVCDEGWRVRKDGTRFWADVVLTALRDREGTLRGFAKVTRDATGRRRAEEDRLRLAHTEEAVRLRDEFLGIASHELRTPVAALHLQLLSVLRELDGRDPDVARKLERALHSAERLGFLVSELLDVSRLATARFHLQRRAASLPAVVRSVVERFRDRAARVGAALSLTAPDELTLNFDPPRVEQAVANLLANAIKYGAPGPVTVDLCVDGDAAVLVVADRGPGFPDEALPGMFRRFERADAHHTYGGLGLGLFLTREIAAAHGGSVRAENAPGGGARVEVRLPLR